MTKLESVSPMGAARLTGWVMDLAGRVRLGRRDRTRRPVALAVVAGLFLSMLVAVAGLLPRAGAVDLPPLVASTPNFGGVAGSFAVSDDGAATYSVPLSVPMGRAGSQVALSLSYNSRAGNGSLGMGWRLEGLSSITVCPRTRAVDGHNEKLFYDGSDALCLGGDRLVPFSPGPVAGAGVPHRAGDVREEHRVWDGRQRPGLLPGLGQGRHDPGVRPGRQLAVGRVPAVCQPRLRQVERESTTVRWPAAWAVNRIEDRDGNVATVEYARSEGDGASLWFADMRPSVIRYAPNRVVQFFYESRVLDGPGAFNDVIERAAAGPPSARLPREPDREGTLTTVTVPTLIWRSFDGPQDLLDRRATRAQLAHVGRHALLRVNVVLAERRAPGTSGMVGTRET
jgi:Salmonella virulence plasmid 65kDa B protein